MNLFIWAPVKPLILDGFKSVTYELTRYEPDYVFVPKRAETSPTRSTGGSLN